MDLMSLFRPQAPAAPGAAAPAQQPMFSGLLPPAGTDERRAFARALLTASAQLANQPGNFLQGATAGLATGGLQYNDDLDQIADKREREQAQAFDDMMADEERSYRRQNDERDYQLRVKDYESRDRARTADSASKNREKQQAIKAGKIDKPSEQEQRSAKELADQFLESWDASAEGQNATPEQRRAVWSTQYNIALGELVGIRRDNTVGGEPADPAGLDIGGIDAAPGSADDPLGLGL